MSILNIIKKTKKVDLLEKYKDFLFVENEVNYIKKLRFYINENNNISQIFFNEKNRHFGFIFNFQEDIFFYEIAISKIQNMSEKKFDEGLLFKYKKHSNDFLREKFPTINDFDLLLEENYHFLKESSQFRLLFLLNNTQTKEF